MGEPEDRPGELALTDAIEWLQAEHGLRLEAIFPADAPRVAVLGGSGQRVRVEVGAEITVDAPTVPPLRPSLVVCRASETAQGTGRAGMRYRDLLPDRQGGRFIASLIEIPEGGPVPDYVHHHDVRFQMIFCTRGWVDVVYQDQGPPFRLEAGDCVLQPPGIRHRVIEASPGMAVIEVGCPAEHPTFVDHELELPTDQRHPERDFGGQRFTRHQAALSSWDSWPHTEDGPAREGWTAQDLGLSSASAGAGAAYVVRGAAAAPTLPRVHAGELLLAVVREGSMHVRLPGRPPLDLGRDDALAVPPGVAHEIEPGASGVEWLEVRV